MHRWINIKKKIIAFRALFSYFNLYGYKMSPLLLYLLAVLCYPVGYLLSEEPLSLQIGMELSNPPFETINTEGQPCGISVELAKYLAKSLHKEAKILDIPFIGLIPSLKAHKIDLIISSMTPTDQRKKAIAFSQPYLSLGLCMLMNPQIKATQCMDLNNEEYTIVVKTGTTAYLHAEKLFPKAKLIMLEQLSSCISEVIQGKASAFFYDQLSIYAAWKKYPTLTKADLHPIAYEWWAIGLRKEEPILQEALNSCLQAFIEKGGIQELKKKYLNEQIQAFAKLGIPLLLSPNHRKIDEPD